MSNLDRYRELGIYDPDMPEAEDRLRLIEYLVELGATDDELLEAHRNSNGGGLALDLATRQSGPSIPFDEAAVQAGLEPEEAARFIRALGFPDPRSAGRPLPAENVEHLARVLVGAKELLGTDTALALARVLGSTTYRLAQTVVSAFRTNFETPQLQSGVPYSEVVRQYVGLAKELLPPFIRALEVVFNDHLVDIASGTWSSDEEGGTVTELCVGFVDMVGYSSLSRGISSGALAELVVRFEDRVSEIVGSHEGRVVKLVGDGAMFVCPDAAGGCALALRLIEHFDEEPDLPPVHLGLAFGPLVDLHGDYFGDAVNVAGRLHDLAPASKALVDQRVAEAVGDAYRVEDVSVWLQRTDLAGPVYELRAR